MTGAATKTLAEIKREHIERVLAQTGGNKTEAAKILGVDRRTLIRLGVPQDGTVIRRRRRRK